MAASRVIIPASSISSFFGVPMTAPSSSPTPLSAITRRRFIQSAAAAAAVSAAPFARAGRVPASERITIGVIGWGMMGPGNTKSFLGNKDCAAIHDYRELLARNDIDAVMIAIPDHWHAIVATEAAARKKDIYGEKPLARTIAEQQAIVRAVHQNNVIWQTGSWQRSVSQFHKAAEIVRNGLIGNVTHVEVGLPGAPHDFPSTVPALLKKLSTLPDKIKDPSQVL